MQRVLFVIPPPEIVELAILTAQHSPCQSKRGVVLWTHTFIVNAHNDLPPGYTCTRDATCKKNCGRCAIHAEQMCLLIAGYRAFGAQLLHVKVIHGKLVPSGPISTTGDEAPSCLECSKLMLGANVAGIWLYYRISNTDCDEQQGRWRWYRARDFHQLTLQNTLFSKQ